MRANPFLEGEPVTSLTRRRKAAWSCATVRIIHREASGDPERLLVEGQVKARAY